jgi:macrodomain Ter protein organizer (MatP/YcbG family)
MAHLGHDHVILRVRLSAADRKRLEELAKVRGLNLSDAVRRLIEEAHGRHGQAAG